MFDSTDEAQVAAIAFVLPAAVGASTVAVVGEFNDWDATANSMDRSDDGSFSTVVNVAVGRTYAYRYLVDGERWENDWNADAYSPNAFGGDDSVLDLTEGSPRRRQSRSAAAPTLGDGSAVSGVVASEGAQSDAVQPDAAAAPAKRVKTRKRDAAGDATARSGGDV
ncbi:MAG: glycoside hydrolase family 13 domain protein [Acidimicrobiales bacterium]|jgi:hypothetical protein|nr:glycoside hydrolase family 13 domain protein [Acidimicrobiales bacterium]